MCIITFPMDTHFNKAKIESKIIFRYDKKIVAVESKKYQYITNLIIKNPLISFSKIISLYSMFKIEWGILEGIYNFHKKISNLFFKMKNREQ